MNTSEIWSQIVNETGLTHHNFSNGPFYVPHKQIKQIVSKIEAPNNKKEIRILRVLTRFIEVFPRSLKNLIP